MPDIEIPLLGEEAADPPLEAAVVVDDLARRGIEALTLLHGVLLDVVAESEHGRETVRELHEAHSGGQAGEPEEVGDGGGEDECDGPVDGDDGGPEDLTTASQEGWRVEILHADIVVEDFDADVAVECSSDEAADDGEDIARGLPAVGRDALVGELEKSLLVDV